MKKNFKKFASMMLALVMAIGLAAPAFAADVEGSNITQVSSTQYTTPIILASEPEKTEFTPVTLYATTTTNWKDNIPFTAESGVAWSWVGGGKEGEPNTTPDGALTFEAGYVPVADYSGPAAYPAPSSTSGFYAKATVKLNASKNLTTGVYSLAATKGESTCNYTIVIQSAAVQQTSVSVDVKVDFGGDDSTLITSVSVPAAATLSESSQLHGDDSGVIQNDPCAIGTLEGLIAKGIADPANAQITSYKASGGYVNDINGKAATDTEGWQYGVYNEDDELIAVSSVVSAGAFPIHAGEKVLWAYGAYGSKVIPNTWSEVEATR